MAKRTSELPGALKSLDVDELECIKKEAKALGLTAREFMVHASTQGEGYIESILKDFLPKHRGPQATRGPGLKSST